MGDRKEQIKQKITLELEKARLWASFLLPMIALSCNLFFTNQFFSHFPLSRYLFGSVVFLGIVFVVLMRNEYIRRVHAYIKEL
jgi:TRAP-type C4-dicarboxylate transport system permease small subunit